MSETYEMKNLVLSNAKDQPKPSGDSSVVLLL